MMGPRHLVSLREGPPHGECLGQVPLTVSCEHSAFRVKQSRAWHSTKPPGRAVSFILRVTMMARKNTVKLRINIFDACEQAAKMLLEAGFVLCYQSHDSGGRHLSWPAGPPTFHVSTHRGGTRPIGVTPHTPTIPHV